MFCLYVELGTKLGGLVLLNKCLTTELYGQPYIYSLNVETSKLLKQALNSLYSADRTWSGNSPARSWDFSPVPSTKSILCRV